MFKYQIMGNELFPAENICSFDSAAAGEFKSMSSLVKYKIWYCKRLMTRIRANQLRVSQMTLTFLFVWAHGLYGLCGTK